jgi:hypothetical protein
MSSCLENYNKKWNLPFEALFDAGALVAYLSKIVMSDAQASAGIAINNTTTNGLVLENFDIDETLDWFVLLLNIINLIPEKLEDRASTFRIVINFFACLLLLGASLTNISLVHDEDTSHQFRQSYYIGPALYLAGSLLLMVAKIHKLCDAANNRDPKAAAISLLSEASVLGMNTTNLFVGTAFRNTPLNTKILAGFFGEKLLINGARLFAETGGLGHRTPKACKGSLGRETFAEPLVSPVAHYRC